MKKILIILMTFLVIASCTKLEDLNKDTKNPTEVPGVTLFSNAQKNLADQIASTSVNVNVFKLWAEYWTETTYTDEANYNIVNRTISDNAWRIWYRNVLMDFKEAGIIIGATEYATDAETADAANQLVIIDIMQVYAWERMVTLWGNIPYTQALDIDNIQPVYEDAATIYQDLLTRLDVAIGALDETHGSFGGADFIYHGDVSAWKKFANTLKLKMGTVIKDAGIVSSAMGGAFTSNADNANFDYLASPPNTNPLYVALVLSGRQDFVATTLITDYMNPKEDPRRPAYFTLAPDTNAYLGGIYGASSPYALYSHVADDIATVPTFACTILSYVEVEFYLAEYYARKDDAANAEAHYNGGITASFEFWGTEGIADYLANPDVAYSTAYDTWQETIATQAWIAFYNNGYLGWTEWRRLGFPVLPLAADAYVNSIPTRFTYPVFEQTLNGTNYAVAASAIGGDLLTTKLWFDK